MTVVLSGNRPTGCRRIGRCLVGMAAVGATALLLATSPRVTAAPDDLAESAGIVPALAERPEDPADWGFQAWGSPNATDGNEAVKSIAASTDGREAWAIGADGDRLTLYRFDGSAWTSCKMEGIGDGKVLPPDPACEGLAPLRARGLVLASVATVPGTEEFEAVAGGWLPAPSGGAVTGVILRYRHGRWTEEELPQDLAAGSRFRVRSVVFTDTDDGWAYAASALDPEDAVMMRFHRGHWINCTESRECDEGAALPDRRFIAPLQSPALFAVGGHVFLAGTRSVFNTSLPEHYYPVILSRRGERWVAEHGFDPAGPGMSPNAEDQGWLNSIGVGQNARGELEGWARESPPGGGRSNVTRRLAPGVRWRRWTSGRRDDALKDHPTGAEVRAVLSPEHGAPTVFMSTDGPLLRFDAAEERWRVAPAPFDPSGANPFVAADIEAMGPDGRGGVWLVQAGGPHGAFFHRYAPRRHRAVFEDVPHPFGGGGIRATAAGPRDTVWLAGDDGVLASYERVHGWSTLKIRGWNRGHGTSEQVTALAIGPDGTGSAVGSAGAIANFTPRGASVDPAASDQPLRAVDIASDRSAMAGGDRGVLLWRPADGELRRIPSPVADDAITGVALPTPDRAWISTSAGRVHAGQRSGATWSWGPSAENLNADGTLVSASSGGSLAVRAIAMLSDGRGYAVGDGGLVMERRASGPFPWRRVNLGASDDLTTVELGPNGGTGALIGAENGGIWTMSDGRFRPARPASTVDGYAGFSGTRVSGIAVLGTDAWASLDGPNGALIRSGHDGPGGDSVTPLPDAPNDRAGELSFVAFGKSDCANLRSEPCPGPSGTAALSDIVSRRIVDAVISPTWPSPRPQFAIFTGDANDHGNDAARTSVRPALLNEWVDLVARPLDQAEVPMLGAIGPLDLGSVRNCTQKGGQLCVSSAEATYTGPNVFWRQAMVKRVGQDDGPQNFGDLRYRPVTDDVLPTTSDVEPPVSGPEPLASPVPTGGARTHYAVDVTNEDKTLVRLVFVDNSLGSLRASDPFQQPPEPRGQLAWLDRILGSRPKGAGAVVVSTSPSYTYRRETVADVADDGASFEEVVLRHRVSAVVSGRVGWNALYYTLAPGLHCPGPGGSYPEHPPTKAEGCGRSSPLPADLPAPGKGQLGPAVPFVISSSAGGKLAEESGEGYWHGYSVIRLDASGDPAKTIVEQRPILDWLVITADRRRLHPGQKVTLKGVGREPPAADTPPRYHRLDSPAITHRYDLLLADRERPWLPERDDDGKYVAMSERHPDCSVACVDRQTGEVRTGEGADERVYAVGLLSAGEHSATYPLVFEPGRPRRPAPAAGRSAALRAMGAAAGRPAATPATPAAAGPPASGSPPPGADLPSFPTFPPSMPTDVRPPEPPAPPTPEAPSPPLSASKGIPTPAAPAGPDAPRVSPVPPSAPKAKPAPRVSLRHDEAEGAQPAAAEFDDDPLDAAEESVDPRDNLLVDIAPAPSMPPGAATTRRAHERPELQMTALHSDDQPSAWVRNAGYGGGLTVAALVLAAGWLAVRSRRRPRPAPATTATRHRGR